MYSTPEFDEFETLSENKYEYDEYGHGVPQDDMDEKVKEQKCTFGSTGENLKFQMYYHCSDCGLDNEGDAICVSCVRKCHTGHKIKYITIEECFCDCGNGEGKEPCKCL